MKTPANEPFPMTLSNRPKMILLLRGHIAYVRFTRADGRGYDEVSTTFRPFDASGALDLATFQQILQVAGDIRDAFLRTRKRDAALAARDAAVEAIKAGDLANGGSDTRAPEAMEVDEFPHDGGGTAPEAMEVEDLYHDRGESGAREAMASAGWTLEEGIQLFLAEEHISSDERRKDLERALNRIRAALQQSESGVTHFAQLSWPRVRKAVAWLVADYSERVAETKRWTALGFSESSPRSLGESATAHGSEQVRGRSKARLAAQQLVGRGSATMPATLQRARQPGFRQTEIGLQALFRVNDWLFQDYPESGAVPVERPPKWKKNVRALWVARCRTQQRKPEQQPRHTIAEYRTILGAALSGTPPCDPRLRLALLIGAELRLGQVLRSWRSDVEAGMKGEALVHLRGTPEKPASTVLLGVREADVLRDILANGYLAELEARFRANGVDYPLFPGGKLRDGKASPKALERGLRYLERSALDAFLMFERLCGVSPVPGRGYYGLKRAAAEAAAELSSDEAAQNEFSQHASSTTHAIYLDPQSRATRAQRKAAALREQTRFGKPKP